MCIRDRSLIELVATLEAVSPLSVLSRGYSIISTEPGGKIISDMDEISEYDYSLFDDQIFLRPYNGKVIKSVDYELSRGCVYACSYCVETTIQQYYGFNAVSYTHLTLPTTPYV